jgi:hypothetical protein
MYENAPLGEAAVMIHPFAIKHAKEIQSRGITATALIKTAEVQESYHAEISKGIKWVVNIFSDRKLSS